MIKNPTENCTETKRLLRRWLGAHCILRHNFNVSTANYSPLQWCVQNCGCSGHCGMKEIPQLLVGRNLNIQAFSVISPQNMVINKAATWVLLLSCTSLLDLYNPPSNITQIPRQTLRLGLLNIWIIAISLVFVISHTSTLYDNSTSTFPSKYTKDVFASKHCLTPFLHYQSCQISLQAAPATYPKSSFYCYCTWDLYLTVGKCSHKRRKKLGCTI